MMAGKLIFTKLARYNRRANREILGALAAITERARKRDVHSWFESAHGIMNHLIIGDLMWLKRFRPILPESSVLSDPGLIPTDISWDHDLCPDYESLRSKRPFVDDRIVAWFEECPEERYPTRFEYFDSGGNRRSALAAEAFEFLFVHQIHHRGAVAQILDELGIPNNVADNGAFLEGAE